jgi:hypothetical protein
MPKKGKWKKVKGGLAGNQICHKRYFPGNDSLETREKPG